MARQYSRLINTSPQIPLLAHIPHNSSEISARFRSQIVLGDSALKEEIRLLTDWFTEDLYNPIVELGGSAVVFDLNRFIVDPERFEDDAQEVMAKVGMGVIYQKTTDGEQLRRDLLIGERDELLQHYRFHHQLLTDAASAIKEKFGYCIVVDCHSYPERPLAYEINPKGDRPDVCVGTDPFHTPPEIYQRIAALAGDFGYSVSQDSPFSGALVPMTFYRRDPSIKAVMLEINRAIYMDEAASIKSESFGKTEAFVRACATHLSSLTF